MILNNFFDTEQWADINALAKDKPTPFLVVHLDKVKEKYLELKSAFPTADVYYAVKANPAREIIELLRELGCKFDIASVYELDVLLSYNVHPNNISYGNTIKKARDIKESFDKGVRLFATDCEADLQNLAKNAPGAKVFLRILTEGGQTADWPLSRKFGCHSEMAVDLMVLAKSLYLDPVGISFHVGSQQNDIGAWDAAIAKSKLIYDRLQQQGITLKILNIGGGMPARYLNKVHTAATYGQAINAFLEEDFGNNIPQIIIEPGRSLVGEAGVIVSEVIMVARKSKNALHRWVYTDIGLFGGLIETLDEAIKYPILCEKPGETEEVILAGPTCDSMDILYEDHRYELPLSLEAGDRLQFLSTGAYTTTYSSVEFNGFPPLKAYYLESSSNK